MRKVAEFTVAAGHPGTYRAVFTYSAALPFADGSVLLACRAGSTKDSDDETIELFRSPDGGLTWAGPHRPFATAVDGVCGSLKLVYLTALGAGRILAAAMWVDRQSHPGKPLFNTDTQGCLPMAILLAESGDSGRTWSPWRRVPMPAEIGPPSLTSPVMRLASGELAMSIETNKEYADRSPWRQKVVYFLSPDDGVTWGEPLLASRDVTGRIFNWDQRACVAPDGRIATFAWTYDTAAGRYLNLRRRISVDHGRTWGGAEDLGFADQAGHPAVLPDGRVVLPWVDRFGTHSIRARVAASVDAPFDRASEVELYRVAAGKTAAGGTSDTLADMGVWTYGLPYAEVLPGGRVAVFYYAGSDERMDIRGAWLEV